MSQNRPSLNHVLTECAVWRVPDLVFINPYDGQDWFVIFDAKYYLLQLKKGRMMRGNPGVGDVTKQYLYQLAYRKFIANHNIAVVKNCFLMPTEGKKIVAKGKVKLEMLSGLGLEDIQIRLVPADKRLCKASAQNQYANACFYSAKIPLPRTRSGNSAYISN